MSSSVQLSPRYMNYNRKGKDLNKSAILTMKAYTCIYIEGSYIRNSFSSSFIQCMTSLHGFLTPGVTRPHVTTPY